MNKKIKKFFGWFQIILGAIILIFWGGMVILSGGGAWPVLYLITFAPCSLWLLTAGLLLLRNKIAGNVMSVLTVIFSLPFYSFIFTLIFGYPSKSNLQHLSQSVNNIPVVQDVKIVNSNLPSMDMLAIHTYCGIEILEDNNQVDKITSQILKVIKEQSPKAKNYSRVIILLRAKNYNYHSPYKVGEKEIPYICEGVKETEFKYNRKRQDFIETSRSRDIRPDSPL